MRGPGHADALFSRYVPYANRALRNFNMYLNRRQPPLRSRNPFTFFRNASSSPPRSTSSPRPPSQTRPISKRSPSAVPITQFPPSSNPRGELIFSSRVDRSFRDSCDRYRSAFEGRREEKERETSLTRAYAGSFLAALPWNPLGPWPPPPPRPIEPTGKGEKGLASSRFGYGARRSISMLFGVCNKCLLPFWRVLCKLSISLLATVDTSGCRCNFRQQSSRTFEHYKNLPTTLDHCGRPSTFESNPSTLRSNSRLSALRPRLPRERPPTFGRQLSALENNHQCLMPTSRLTKIG